MKRKPVPQLREEPEITEIRRARAKLWKKGGGTVQGMMDMIRARQDARDAAGEVVAIPKRAPGRTAVRKKRRAA